MYLLITYDIETTADSGKKALAKVGRLCKGYGIRVQNSVWECLLDPTELEDLKMKLQVTMGKEKGNIRIYQLPKTWDTKTTQVIGEVPLRITDTIII